MSVPRSPPGVIQPPTRTSLWCAVLVVRGHRHRPCWFETVQPAWWSVDKGAHMRKRDLFRMRRHGVTHGLASRSVS
jgi:hypothetical protein